MRIEDTELAEDMALVEPTRKTSRRFFVTISILIAVIIVALIAYLYQYRTGLAVTGLSRQIFWGVYITNFVFFIGISHAGALIVAVLRLVRAEWRRPITRCAEVITVLALLFGVANILIDLGRPDRMLFIVTHAHFRSPLLWDVISVSTYLIASATYLYISMIPDLALLRDNGDRRKWLYQILSLGWTGEEKQQRILNKVSSFMAVFVVMLAVTVHTVVSFVFVMTIQPMWHSAVLAPYFVVGAIFSGIAALTLVVALARKVFHLENYLKLIHFNNLGLFLLTMSLFWFYFTLAEFLTAFYGNEPSEMAILWSKLVGTYAPYFWVMFTLCFIIPVSILAFKKTRTITGTVIASISIVIGMWLERYAIIVPTLTGQRLSLEPALYFPTWVEWLILAGCVCLFTVLYMIFAKLFPIISISEIREGREEKNRKLNAGQQ
jgi:Ni/Fe-hydrogenase subunit HybB-like protein